MKLPRETGIATALLVFSLGKFGIKAITEGNRIREGSGHLPCLEGGIIVRLWNGLTSQSVGRRHGSC